MDPSQSFRIKLLLVLVCALASVIVGTFAGILSYTTRPSLAQAVLYGGGAFSVSMGLSLTTLSALGLL
ncbi:hypothetical protein OG900_10205 [Streptomyces sp. NBC_00433]